MGIQIDEEKGNIRAGLGVDGDLILDGFGTFASIHLDGGSGKQVQDPTVRAYLDGKGANLYLGGGDFQPTSTGDDVLQAIPGADGDIVLKDSNGNDRIHLDGNGSHRLDDARIYLDGKLANIFLGGKKQEGDDLNDITAPTSPAEDGDLILKNSNGDNRIHLDGGGNSRVDNTRIYLNGNKGEVSAKSIILESPNGTNFRVTVDNNGDLSSESL